MWKSCSYGDGSNSAMSRGGRRDGDLEVGTFVKVTSAGEGQQGWKKFDLVCSAPLIAGPPCAGGPAAAPQRARGPAADPQCAGTGLSPRDAEDAGPDQRRLLYGSVWLGWENWGLHSPLGGDASPCPCKDKSTFLGLQAPRFLH